MSDHSTRRGLFGSLDRRLAVALLVLLIALGIGTVASTLWTTGNYQREVDQELHRDLASHLLKASPELEAGDVRPESIKPLLMTLMKVNPRIEVYLLDAAGKVLAYDAPPGRVRSESVSLAPIQRFLDGERLPVLGDDPRNPSDPNIFSVARIPPPDSLESPARGYLYVVLAGEQYGSIVDRMSRSYILRLAFWRILAALVTTLIAGWLLVRLLTRRVKALDRRMKHFEDSGFRATPIESSKRASGDGDEIDRLEATFQRMAERIAEQVEELKEVDRLRRELVANVSHDLRTPLATLQGYLETLLLKDESLPDSERRNYLEIASAQSERLGKLVAELFELTQLDAQETPLDCERFSVAELAQDLAQKFRLAAAEKQVELVAELPQNLPIVHADLRLIERTLENLIENALRHTEAGGQVQVSLTEKAGRVRVSVADTGCGIPAEDLPRIFDRFYRGKATTSRRDGAGLGLAIARRVLELHGSQIAVESTVDTGTRFSFELSQAAAAT